MERDALSGGNAVDTRRWAELRGSGLRGAGSPGGGPRANGLLQSTLSKGRKGIPQGSHAHGLLTSGYRVLEAYFPSLIDELVQAGATRCDVTGTAFGTRREAGSCARRVVCPALSQAVGYSKGILAAACEACPMSRYSISTRCWSPYSTAARRQSQVYACAVDGASLLECSQPIS